MSKKELYIAGTKVSLGKRIGQGGEGDVYSLIHSDQLVLKLYTLKDLGDREEKIKAMVSAGLSKNSASIAFPVSIATFQNNQFAGFVMPFVAGHKPVHQLYSPAPRKRYFQNADYRFLIRTALNISKAIENAHEQNCVIGDINHSGILISDKATAVLIDADSFQFSYFGKTFLCKVGVPEYTPPELQGKKLSETVRTKNHDAFALSVLIFQILFMGRHPFAGTFSKGEISLENAISEYRFAYSQQRVTGMQQPPGTVNLTDMPDRIANLFEQAFAKVPERPNASTWVEALKEFENNIRACNTNPRHFFYRLAPRCPWCRIEESSGVDQFPQAIIGKVQPPNFDQTSIFDQVAALQLPQLDILPTLILQFRPNVISPQPKSIGKYVTAATIVIVAIFIFAAQPGLWWISIALAIWAYTLISSTTEKSSSDLIKNLEHLDRQLSSAVLKWREDSHLLEAYALKNEMQNLKIAYGNLTKINSEILTYLKSTRRQRALLDHLDKHFIQHAKIPGFGPSKVRLISSYGFDTAGDLKRRTVTIVPGIGPVLKSHLDNWVTLLEQRFVYKASPSEDAADQAIASKEVNRIAADILREAMNVQKRILSITSSIQSALKSTSTDISKLIEQRSRLAGEIISCGGTVPSFKSPNSVVRFRAPKQWTYKVSSLTNISPVNSGVSNLGSNQGTVLTRAATNTPVSVASSQSTVPNSINSTSNQTPNCPSCGQHMIMRTAKKGRRRGRPFWGCSSYPRCRGTRSI